MGEQYHGSQYKSVYASYLLRPTSQLRVQYTLFDWLRHTFRRINQRGSLLTMTRDGKMVRVARVALDGC